MAIRFFLGINIYKKRSDREQTPLGQVNTNTQKAEGGGPGFETSLV